MRSTLTCLNSLIQFLARQISGVFFPAALESLKQRVGLAKGAFLQSRLVASGKAKEDEAVAVPLFCLMGEQNFFTHPETQKHRSETS